MDEASGGARMDDDRLLICALQNLCEDDSGDGLGEIYLEYGPAENTLTVRNAHLPASQAVCVLPSPCGPKDLKVALFKFLDRINAEPMLVRTFRKYGRLVEPESGLSVTLDLNKGVDRGD